MPETTAQAEKAMWLIRQELENHKLELTFGESTNFRGSASWRFVAAIFRGGAVTKNARYQAASCGCGEDWGAGLEVWRLHESLRSPLLFSLGLQGCAAFPPVAMRKRQEVAAQTQNGSL